MKSGLRKASYAILLIVSFPLSGCIGAHHVAEQEVLARTEDAPESLTEFVQTASELSDEYLSLAGEASTGQDILALGIISAAATAAGGGLFNSHADLILGAGLAAGTINGLSNYLKPAEANKYLLTAAEQMTCIIQQATPYVNSHNKNAEALGIVEGGILQIRINLRKKLTRDTPNFGELVEKLKASIENKEETKRLEKLAKAKPLDELRTQINACPLLGE